MKSVRAIRRRVLIFLRPLFCAFYILGAILGMAVDAFLDGARGEI